MRIAPSLRLTEPERQQLTQGARGRRTPAPRHDGLVRNRGPRHPAPCRRPGHPSADRGLLAASRRAPAPARPRPGCPRGGRPPQAPPGADRPHSEDDDPDDTARRHSLVDPHLGSALADESYVCAAGLDRPWPATPPGSEPARSARIRTSRTSWRMWWACLGTRPSMPSSSAWMRTARSTPWIAPSLVYP
jgi:hypothetical protein